MLRRCELHLRIRHTGPSTRLDQTSEIEGIGDEGSRVDLRDETRRFIDLVAQINQDPVLAGYSRYLQQQFPSNSYYRGYLWSFLLFNDPNISPVGDGTLASLSPYLLDFRLFGRHAMNLGYIVMVGRKTIPLSALRPATPIPSTATMMPVTSQSSKQSHLPLTAAPMPTSPRRTVKLLHSQRGKNTLLIMRPNERIPSLDSDVSDGGQRVILPTSNPISHLEQWTQNYREGMHLEGGELFKKQNLENSYSYMAVDLTGAYNNREFDDNNKGGKVRKVSRQLLYLHDEDRLLVFDHVDTTRPEYTKKWLLHSINRPHSKNTRIAKGTLDNGIIESRDHRVVIINDNAYLTLDRLLPRKAIARFIGGSDYQYYVESDGDDRELKW